MPTATTSGTGLRFEEIPTAHRPVVVARFLALLDEGYDPEHIRFRRYGEVLRVERTDADGRPGTSYPANIASRMAGGDATGPSRKRLSTGPVGRRAQLAALDGIRVRASWPSGHERIGVIQRGGSWAHQLVCTDLIGLCSPCELPAIEPFTPASGLTATPDRSATTDQRSHRAR